jgi:hypothetical protein
VRNDAWVRDHGAPVEVDKPEHEKGSYLYPGGFHQPESRGAEAHRRSWAEAQQTATEGSLGRDPSSLRSGGGSQ